MKINFLRRKRINVSNEHLFDLGNLNSKKQKNLTYDDSMIKKNNNIKTIEEYIWNIKRNHVKLLKDIKMNRFFLIRPNGKSKIIIYNENEKNQENQLEKEEDYCSHYLKLKKYSLKQLVEISQILPDKKFNMILDIDLTMIKAVKLEDTRNQRKVTDIIIKGIANFRIFQFYFRYRPYLLEFVKELKYYFNFYISTLGHKNYADKILDNLNKMTGIDIPQNRINAKTDDSMFSKNRKFIKELIPLSNKDEINNTIIIDDNIINWIKPEFLDVNNEDTIQCLKSLIPSKRYVMEYPQNIENYQYSILLYNNIFEKGFDKDIKYTLDIDYPFCIEKDSISNYSYGQLYFLELFLKNCIKICLLSGIPIIEAVNIYRKKIFDNCFFNLKFLENKWHHIMISIIKELGGNISFSIEEATHFIIESKIDSNKIIFKKDFQQYVNVNYIFQCYFNLYKFSENDIKFSAIIND